MGVMPESQMPPWFRALLEAVRVRLTVGASVPYAGMGAIVDKDAVEHGIYVVRVYPRPVEVSAGTPRAEIALPAFRVNLAGLLEIWDEVHELTFAAGLSEDEAQLGDYVKLRGRYANNPVTLYLCVLCPPGEKPVCPSGFRRGDGVATGDAAGGAAGPVGGGPAESRPGDVVPSDGLAEERDYFDDDDGDALLDELEEDDDEWG